jgi:hypothetical protein
MLANDVIVPAIDFTLHDDPVVRALRPKEHVSWPSRGSHCSMLAGSATRLDPSLIAIIVAKIRYRTLIVKLDESPHGARMSDVTSIAGITEDVLNDRIRQAFEMLGIELDWEAL